MFNYHTYEKLNKKKLEEEEDKYKQQIEAKKRKIKNKMLVENYEKRINNFIISLVTQPVKIKDYTNPVENPRMQLMKETDNKIQGRKGFIFKGFITEKERVKQYLEERKKYTLEIDGEHDEQKTKKDGYTYVQPKMRFKARTDLERIFESINDYSYGRVSKDAINKQLKDLDLNYMKKIKANSDDSYSADDSSKESKTERFKKINFKEILLRKDNQEKLAKMEEAIANMENLNKMKQNFVKEKSKSRKRVDNSGAKSLMKEYHLKTHFKAASVVANRNSNKNNTKFNMSNNDSHFNSTFFKRDYNKRNSNLDTLNSKQEISFHDEESKSEIRPSELNTKSNFFNSTTNPATNTQSFNLFQKFSKNFALDEENLDIIESNPLLYNLNVNPLKKQEVNEYVDKNKLSYLKSLAYSRKEMKKENSIKKKAALKLFLEVTKSKSNPSIVVDTIKNFTTMETEGNELRDDEKVWLDNQAIPKTQVDLIAKKVLKKCNYFHEKKDRQGLLKKGRGKLMITSGMTINEFSRKYNIPK